MMKRILTILLALAMLAGLSTAALAAASVTFKGGAENFVFLPGGAFSETDMFENFKGVMPGDVLLQRITVRNNSAYQVRLYLKAEPVNEKYADFLSRMNLQVSCKDEQIFDAAASETGQLTENVLLGTFKSYGSTELLLTLTVPFDVDNQYMLATGIIPWTFTAEEVVEEDTPHTGDIFDLGTWMLAAAMILAAIAYVLVQMKRQKQKSAQ